MATKQEIRNKALKRLGVLDPTGTATASQSSDLDAAYNEVYAFLERKNLVAWDSTEDIPSEYVESIVALTAKARVNEYEITQERRIDIKNDAQSAFIVIRETKEDAYYSNSQDAEYY